MENYAKIQEAKEYLKSQGYYTNKLWSVADVKSKFNCTNEQAQTVLSGAMDNEATMEQIWFAIDLHGEDMVLEKIEN